MKQALYFFCVILFASSCSTTRNASGNRDDGKIEVRFIQMNDVYEIAPLSGGKEGGIARIATLKKQNKQQNPNTYLVIAGDFLSPSVFNSLQYQGKAIRGRQMIETLNAAGTDLAVFGNHEFDIKESELQERINESEFQWLSTNTFHKTKDKVIPFSKTGGLPIPQAFILDLKDNDGTKAKIGFISACLPFNKADYVSYTDAIVSAKDAYNKIKDSVDAVVAITHQSMDDDRALAMQIPGIAAIIGGHEHDQRYDKIGKVYITKSLANAKSAYIINLKINQLKKRVKVNTKLEVINEKISLDSATNVVVEKWTTIAENNYASLGFDARKIVMQSGVPLDGRETEVRTHPTNLTRLIVEAMSDAVPNADVVLMNSGSIRVDDILQMPVTQYDIIRTLPFGGGIQEADMKGSLLVKVLNQGMENKGIGGYLLFNENLVKNANGSWTLSGNTIDPSKVYHVAITEFLFTGKEANLEFLHPGNPEVIKSYPAETGTSSPKSDIRLALIRYLEKKR